MSGTGPRESIFPTRMALTNTKTRLKGAQTGHSLLAKKRDALTTRFRAILRKVDDVSPVARDNLLHHHLVKTKTNEVKRHGENTGEAEDGTGDAARVVLSRRGHVRHRRHRISCASTSQIGFLQSQSEARECLWRRPARVRSRSRSRNRYVVKKALLSSHPIPSPSHSD